jgi:hypothetical protein
MRPSSFLVAIVAASVVLASPGAPAAQEDRLGLVDSLMVVGGEAPVPEVGPGEPNYSPEQTAGVICAALDERRGQTAIFNLEKAHQATVRAKKARRDFRLGKASQGEVNSTELARQLAIRGNMTRIRLSELAPSHRDGLVVENLTQRRTIEHGRPVMLVSGVVRNFGTERRETPPILIYAIDSRDFALASQTNAIETQELAPGESAAFTVRYRNPPAYTAKLHGTFAPPFLTRAYRGCGFFDPTLYDNASLDVQKLALQAKVTQRPPENGAAPYFATELASMARITFLDAMDAYQSDQAVRAGTDPYRCAPAQGWRELLGLGELIEEAWIATNAAEEVRRDAKRDVFLPEEVEAADRARAAAIKAFMAARPKGRTLGAPPANLAFEKLAVQLDGTNSNFFAVTGELRNNGDTPAVKAPVLVQVKDRFGYVISERHYRLTSVIPPKGSARFTFNFELPRSLGNQLDVNLAC